ncbi:MAG: nitrate reductase [Pirellula sp.]|nr:nitrate reductase [Pirellula sp.]
MAGDEICELTENVADSPYWSPDMAPVGASGRKWGLRDIAVLWISMSACIPTYMLASSLIEKGMDWRQAVVTIFLGNCIVLIPMVLNAHAGTKYGISFPVYCRASFGILGANVPALLRAFVACGWFGIQTWIGGEALFHMLAVFAPGVHQLPDIAGLGINGAELVCFLLFWLVNMAVVWRGIDSIRVLLNIKAPLLIGLGLLLLGWAYDRADGFGPILSKPSEFADGGSQAGKFWLIFFPALTANVSYWATLSLNIPDFSRYARSQRDQAWGQALGLPTTMGLFSFIGVAVTSAAHVIYHDLGPAQQADLWKPMYLLSLFDNPVVLCFAMFAVAVATLATNIAANVVSPANDFAHLWPKRITFRIGGLITGLIGIAIQPWRLLADPNGYIFTWLIGISVLLGAVGGVLIADYYFIRKTRLDLAGLYRRRGPYWYAGGFNPIALVALAVGIALGLPGFLAEVGAIDKPSLPEFWKRLYDYAWFASFGAALAVFYVLTLAVGRDAKQSA